MNVLVWHVHGSWTTAFVQGRHTYLIPAVPERGPWGIGRPAAWDWPARAVEVTPAELAETKVDVAVLQRPEEIGLAARWTGRHPGRDLPAVYVEHNTPPHGAATSRHPLADRDDVLVVHVTDFNRLMWDCGAAPTTVIPHGIVDPGERYTGEIERAAVVINDPVRRWRAVGTDLLPTLSCAAGIDVFGMGLDRLAERMGDADVRPVADLPQHRLHQEMARRRVYLHPTRWTSLGLSLLEAMHLGMPVVALATTEASMAVPVAAGVVTTSVRQARRAVAELVTNADRAAEMGRAARKAALAAYGLPAFLQRWDSVLDERS